jgi:hypothetical protein
MFQPPVEWHAVLVQRVSKVIARRTGEDVMGVATGGVVAGVTGKQAVRQVVPVMDNVCDPMGEVDPTADSQTAIATPQCPLPRPALVIRSNVNEGPEPLDWRYTLGKVGGDN